MNYDNQQSPKDIFSEILWTLVKEGLQKVIIFINFYRRYIWWLPLLLEVDLYPVNASSITMLSFFSKQANFALLLLAINNLLEEIPNVCLLEEWKKYRDQNSASNLPGNEQRCRTLEYHRILNNFIRYGKTILWILLCLLSRVSNSDEKARFKLVTIRWMIMRSREMRDIITKKYNDFGSGYRQESI